MNYSLFLLLAAACVVLHVRPSSAAISCYVCSGTKSSGVTVNSACVTIPTGTNASSSVLIDNDCSYCLTVKATEAGVTSYARSCSSVSISTGCVSVAGASSCTYSCSTNLCNTGDAPSLRYALGSLLGALILSATGRFYL